MTDHRNPSMPPRPTALRAFREISASATSPAGLYDAWLLAEAEASLALAAWRWAPRVDSRRAYAVYVDALEAEEAAAARLAQRLAAAA